MLLLCDVLRGVSLNNGMTSGVRVQINGRPFVVREADKPFQNLEYTGIDRSRVEDMERRLKADVLCEVPAHECSWTARPAVCQVLNVHVSI